MNTRAGLQCAIVLGTLGAWAAPSRASFHLMQIEQVIGGVNGNTTAQAIQLRMRGAGQNFLSGAARMRAFDSAGLNPVTIIVFSGANPGGGAGRRILIRSANFSAQTTPPAVAEYTMTNLIPSSYLAAGSLTFESSGGAVYWRLSWGGASYTGSGSGVGVGGNDADGNFNPPYPGPLPSNGALAILFDGAAADPSTNNAADYILTPGPAVFINNAAVPGMFTVNACDMDADCNDAVACTVDACASPVCTFTPLAPGSPCGNPSTGECDAADSCDLSGVCQPNHLAGPCTEDGNACTDDVCTGGTCVHPNNTDPCDDGMFCTDVDACAGGACVGSGSPCPPAAPFCNEGNDTCAACNMNAQCDDGIACSMDTCVGGFCNHTPNHASCNNGLFCDGVEVCNLTMAGCESPGTPCNAGESCNEAGNLCESSAIRIQLIPVAGGVRGDGLVSPVYLTHANDGSNRLFVLDQQGMIRIIENEVLLPEPYLDLTASIPVLNTGFDERGLLGLAFHTDYMNNGRFFVRYSVPRPGMPGEPCFGTARGCHKERLSEFAVSMADPNVADAGSEVILFEVDKPQFNHDGGQVAFGPGGYLFFSLGDGGGAHDGLADGMPPGSAPSHGPIGNGQNRFTTLGKILRIDVGTGASLPDDFPGDPLRNYAIPPTNPFANGVNGAPEIYAYGMRNPYRFSFDRATNDLYVADVGQAIYEEVNLVTLGGNYGWAAREGAHFFDPFNPGTPPAMCLPMWAGAGIDCDSMIDPVSEYTHSAGGLAIIGGYVYRGTESPVLEGHYIYGDFSANFGPTGRLYYFETTGPNAYERVQFIFGPDDLPLGKVLKGIGEDEDGEIYVCVSDVSSPTSGMTGGVFRIAECDVARYGDIVFPFGVVDVDDISAVLGSFVTPGLFPEADIEPCGGDGDVDSDDILGVLGAFIGFEACPPACRTTHDH